MVSLKVEVVRIHKTEFRRLAGSPELPSYTSRGWWSDQPRSRLGVLMRSMPLKWWVSVVMASSRKPVPIIPEQSAVFVVDMGVSDTRQEALIELHKLLTKPHYL